MTLEEIIEQISVKPYYQDEAVVIYCADCRNILPSIRVISAVVTDPPYNLISITKRFGKEGSAPAKYGKDGSFQRLSKGFMGKEWDGTGVSFQIETWQLILESCLPGASLLSFGGTRTSHRIACAIEDAGWQIRDTIMWVYGSGFPKSLDISKAIDKKAGAEREKVWKRYTPKTMAGAYDQRPWLDEARKNGGRMIDVNTPVAPEAKLWEGYGTALKPAYEPIILAMKPLDGTFANNALKHGVAGLNIDRTRIPTGDTYLYKKCGGSSFGVGSGVDGTREYSTKNNPKGRFPANFIHDGSQEVMELFPDRKGMSGGGSGRRDNSMFGVGGISKPEHLRNDSGSAARFFYCAKASRAERDAGLEDMLDSIGGGMQGTLDQKLLTGSGNIRNNLMKNNHPTVKPLALMNYLCKLVKMPEYNLVLDPFCGSGTTLLACKKLGIPCIGIDNDEKSCEIAKQRLAQMVMKLGIC